MASIVGKRRGKQIYYYLVESARVGGKPRIVSQRYLGSAEEVLAKLSQTPTGQPTRSQHKQFGDLAAVWSALTRLGVVGIVDEVAPHPPRPRHRRDRDRHHPQAPLGRRHHHRHPHRRRARRPATALAHRLLGHESMATSQRYVAATGTETKQAAAQNRLYDLLP
jgi:hypothetical protein